MFAASLDLFAWCIRRAIAEATEEASCIRRTLGWHLANPPAGLRNLVRDSRSPTRSAEELLHLDVRLARWLLMCQDRIGGDELYLTHEFLSLMLGAQRSSTTLAIQSLKGHRLIKARRGCITLRDREALEAVADAGYGLPEAEHARLIEGA